MAGCNIRTQKKIVASQPQSVSADRSAGHNRRVHNQMFILMLSSVGIFLVTTLLLTIYHVVSSYTTNDIAGIEKLSITTP
jgi:hypothetical protein